MGFTGLQWKARHNKLHDWQMDFDLAVCYPTFMGEIASNEEHNPKPLFSLGQLVGTPGALQALQEAEQDPLELLARHITGDWGDLDYEDKKENNISVEQGFRILSAYTLNTGVKVWIITEWNRSATTILLPSEY